MSDQHSTTVVLQRAWDEHRPECTCGWVGSYWPTRNQARREAEAHTEPVRLALLAGQAADDDT